MITDDAARWDPAAASPPGPVYALLADGSTAEIRPAAPGDAEAVRAMHADMSPDQFCLRFFSLSPSAAQHEASRVCRPPGPDHAVLVAWLDGRLAGIASYELGTDRNGSAEVAFAVPDDLRGRGIATLLLEHLVSIAQSQGLTAFTATTLAEDYAMLSVFADAGLPVRRAWADGECQLTIPLPDPGAEARDDYLDHVASREEHADAVSLRHLLQPRAVAVIGVGRRLGSPGHTIVRNLIAGGFTGDIYLVNTRRGRSAGRTCLASVSELPEGVDLAIIAVPAAAVPQVAADCGRRGVRSLAVLTTGLGTAGADLLAICRRHGMRLAGPGSVGVMTPGQALNATCAAEPAAAGIAGLVSQSGGMGLALASQLSRLGIGISSFVSVGEKYDISSNDLLMWWDQDRGTRLAVLYVESFGNPRKFARTARRVGRRMPVLTVTSEPSGPAPDAPEPGPAGRTAAPVTRDALFGQAGIIATRTVTELTEAAALLAGQPLPAGNRVAVVSSSRAASAQAAAACRAHGLAVAQLSVATGRRLRGLLPPGAGVRGPVTTTLAVTPGVLRACLEQVAADEGVDAVLAVSVATANGLPDAALGAALPAPLALVRLDQAESVTVRRSPGSDARGPGAGVPCYADPQSAARALGHAARYSAWRRRQADPAPRRTGIRATDARDLVARALARRPGGGWLAPSHTATLMSSYGLPAGTAPAGTPVKAELSITVRQEPVFGPLISLGLSGPSAGLITDTVSRLAPLTRADAGEMIGELRAAAILFGHHGDRAVDTGALEDLLLRVAHLADDLPEVAELDLDPVLATPAGVWARSARARVQAASRTDPFLRQLR